MKKNSRVRRWLAMILCMTLVLSSNVVSMAAEENGTEVQAITEEPVIEETEPAAADEPVPEDITETETLMTETPETVPTEEPATEEPTEEPVDTEIPTETVTEPETPEVPETPETPTQDETEEPVEMETPAMPEAPGAQEEPGAGEEPGVQVEELPEFTTANDIVGLTPKSPHEPKDLKQIGDEWKCKWSDDHELGWEASYGLRHEHYVRIKYNSGGGPTDIITYIRCDKYGGEKPNREYFPVFFINENKESIIEGERFFETVLKGEKPQQTPKKDNGYWTYCDDHGVSIGKQEQLKEVTDTGNRVINGPESEVITRQMVFMWHENPTATYTLDFTKVSEEKEIDGNYKPLKDAEFELFLNKESKGTARSGEDGKVTFANLEPGTYTLKEKQAPEGYITLETEWIVQIDGNGTVTITGDGVVKDEATQEFQILNKREGGELNFTKTDTAGVALSGAEFALYATDDEKYENSLYTGISDKFGNVKITGIPVGTYTMKETKAPAGYLVSGLVWTVEVTKTGETIEAVLKDGNGEEVSTITNRKNNEYIPADVERNKTARLIDWEKRTYRLDLTANSLMETTTQGSVTPIDVVLVLDVSGSMGFTMGYTGLTGATSYGELKHEQTYYFVEEGVLYEVYYEDYGWFGGKWKYKKSGSSSEGDLTNFDEYNNLTYFTGYDKEVSRLDGLKEAAESFVGTLKGQSPDSRVGIVTFQSQGLSNPVLPLTKVDNDQIITEIRGLNANGGTYPSEAITKAGEMFGENNPREKHVIFLTDGDCGQNSNKVDNEEISRCITNANDLKGKNIEIHAIRFATTKAHYLEQIVTDVITDSDGNPGGGKVYTANNIDELIESFNLILQGSVDKLPVAGATIIDTIDNHFIVTDSRGNPLEDGATIYPDTTPIVGTLEIDGAGNQKIVWENQTIAVEDKGKPGWEATIYIKAKADYIGGNGVTTNGSDSGIYIGNTPLQYFPVPEVNVKADLSVEDTETTIFLGEVVPTEGVQNDMFSIPTGTTENNFTFAWYKDEACEKQISLEEIKSEKPKSQKKYYLKVTYHAGNPADLSHSQMNGHVNGSLENGYTIADNGVYTVNVVSGTIKIHKVLEGTNNIQLEGAPTFTFKIEYTSPEGGSTQVSYKTVKFNNENVTELWTEELTNLPKGDYKITELETLKFTNTSITAEDDTTCASDSDANQITFHIGTAKEGAQDKGQIGIAKFVNEKTGDSGKRTDTDVRVNRFTKENGKWTWKGYDLSTSKTTSNQQ